MVDAQPGVSGERPHRRHVAGNPTTSLFDLSSTFNLLADILSIEMLEFRKNECS